MKTQAHKLVHAMSKQPAFARELIKRFVEAIVEGRATYHIPEDQMDAEKQLWLEKHFDMEYDEKIHEYKINLI